MAGAAVARGISPGRKPAPLLGSAVPPVDTMFGMWATFAIIVVALVLYATERLPLTVTSLGVICLLLLVFHFAPVPDGSGLGPARLLAGFANPALLALVGLLIMGQGLAQTGVLERGAGILLRAARGNGAMASFLAFFAVLVVSGFLNNTPVVVIFIPVMQSLAERMGQSPSRLMMPLSYAAILGGMTTLIGSSTNLLVSGALIDLGREGLTFFEFTVPGVVLALSGLVYVVFIAPFLMPRRRLLTSEIAGEGRQFIAQITVPAGSRYDGLEPRGGFFPQFKNITVRMVQRGEHAFVPPFDDAFHLEAGDVIVVAATRKSLTEAFRGETDILDAELADEAEIDGGEGAARRKSNQMIAEVMVTPTARIIGQTLEMIGFRYRYHCLVLGIQRQSRMIRSRMTEIRLEAGDVLLIQGRRGDIQALRGDPDILLVEWSAAELPSVHHARRAMFIFFGAVALAGAGILPIVTAALCGAGLMLVTGVLNVRQAGRAIDRNVVMMIAAALALGLALQETGGAQLLGDLLLRATGDYGPRVALSAFFLLVALLANVISTKATAVLFTPIALTMADGLGVPALPFVVAVIFAANCAFASPVGYQTNLLIMAPGNYRFADFVRAGLPLLFFSWVVFSLFAPWYYGF